MGSALVSNQALRAIAQGKQNFWSSKVTKAQARSALAERGARLYIAKKEERREKNVLEKLIYG